MLDPLLVDATAWCWCLPLFACVMALRVPVVRLAARGWWQEITSREDMMYDRLGWRPPTLIQPQTADRLLYWFTAAALLLAGGVSLWAWLARQGIV